MSNALTELDVQRVDAKRAKETLKNENIIGVRVESIGGAEILAITAKSLQNKKYFRKENLTLSLEEVEKASIFHILNMGVMDRMHWEMVNECEEPYEFNQLIIIDEGYGRKILAEGTWDFCYKCEQELKKLFTETRENEYRTEIEALLQEAESLTVFGEAKRENINMLLERARKLDRWNEFSEYGRWVRKEALRISNSIRVGDSVLGGSLLSFKVK